MTEYLDFDAKEHWNLEACMFLFSVPFSTVRKIKMLYIILPETRNQCHKEPGGQFFTLASHFFCILIVIMANAEIPSLYFVLGGCQDTFETK